MSNKNQQIKVLTERNEELENYFSNTIIPQLFIDADLVLKKFTPPAMKQFRLSALDIGLHFDELVNNLRFPSITENIQHVIDTRQILEKEIQTNDLRWYQMNIIPYILAGADKADGVIITFVDITVRIRDLKEQERLISDYETLLDTISHDVKTPLTNLVLAIELFKQGSVTDPVQYASLLTKVENSIAKMRNIIRELTETRREEHKYQAGEELLSVEHILEDVRLTLRDQMKESGAVIRADISISEIVFSRRKLRTIIYNLISNSIKYRSPDRSPEIIVRTTAGEGGTVITVADNGIGIPAEKQQAVFSKYYRVENKLEGSGIGLYLVQEIVTGAGGTISLSSELGKGSEFKIVIKDKN